jgi:hypothetical protein
MASCVQLRGDWSSDAIDEVMCSFTIAAGAFFEMTGILNVR